MKIMDITPKALEKEPDAGLLNLHRHVHGLYSQHFEGNTKETTDGLTREDVINAHRFIEQEMERRDMKHDSPIDGLPRKSNAQLGWVPGKEGNLPDEIMVVPQFVSVVGSVAKGFEGDDLDVLLRTEKVGENKLAIWSDNVHLPLRKVLDPRKTGGIHWIANPQGPHSASIPLYDLVLRRREHRSQQAKQPGLYLVEPHAEMIWKGEKKAVVKSRRFDVEEKRYILVSDGPDGKAWGMIELGPARVITLEEFTELRPKHKVTEEERKKWWGDYEKLYYHEIKDFARYEQPKKVSIPKGVQTFVRDVVLAEAPSSEPVKIDLGCGDRKAEGFVGVDQKPGPAVDVVYNLNMGLPFPDDYADEIRAHHILEHLHDPVFSMTEIWRVLKPDGILDVAVPSTKGEGAFAHPLHSSFWNKSAFYFYCDDVLRKECGFLGKFEILWLDEMERGEAIDVRGRLKAVKEDVQVALAVSPWYSGPLAKPSLAIHTEFFTIGELYKRWAESRLEDGIAVELKLNGFRTLASKKGNQVRIEFEDTRKDVSAKFPDLVKALMKSDKDVILDCSLGIIGKDGKPWPRIRLMTLTAAKPKIPEDAQLLLTAFDVLYGGEDVTELPLSERRPRLEATVRKIGDKHVDISQQIVVKSKAELEKAAKKLAGLPGSEGVVVKEWESKYPKAKATSSWAKAKQVSEWKCIVLDKKQTKHGMWNYRCGVLLGVGKYTNVVEIDGKKYVDLKWTYNTPLSISKGSILTVAVEELILRDTELNWLGPSVIDVDRTRKEPYYAQQVVGMAKRGHILQDARMEMAMHRKDRCMDCSKPPVKWVLWAEGKAQAWFCLEHYEKFKKDNPDEISLEHDVEDGDVSAILEKRKKRKQHGKQMEEGETRSARAARFWKEHWHEMMPMSGAGVFVYHHHWRGLREEESKLSEEELLKTSHSVHGDPRFSFDSALWGFTTFLGKTADLRGGRDLARLPYDDALEGKFKLTQPKEWLTIARKKPFISEPGGPGATSESWAVFFENDHGRYELGVVHRSFIELFLHGKKLKGRYMIQKAQREDGSRYWQIARSESQKPYAEEHDKEKELARLKKRGHTIVFWSKPGEKLERIDLTKWKEQVTE